MVKKEIRFGTKKKFSRSNVRQDTGQETETMHPEMANREQSKEMTREDFLRILGTASVGVAAAGVLGSGVAHAQVIDNGDGSCTVYPKGTETLDFNLTQGSNSIPCTEDAYNIEQAINGFNVVKLARNNESGDPTTFKVYTESTTSDPDAVINIWKNVTLTALDPENPPELDCQNKRFAGYVQDFRGIQITADECSLENLVIYTNRSVYIYTDGNVEVKNCYIENFFINNPYRTVSSQAIEANFLSPNILLIGNDLYGAPVITFGTGSPQGGVGPENQIPFEGHVTAVNNNITATAYGHFDINAIGLDVSFSSESSSVLMNNNRIHLYPNHKAMTSLATAAYFGYEVAQQIIPILLGNIVWGTGAKNVTIMNLIVDIEIDDPELPEYYPSGIAFIEYSHNCDLKNITYSGGRQSYDWSELYRFSNFARFAFYLPPNPTGPNDYQITPNLFEPEPFVSAADYVFYNSESNTLMDNKFGHTIYDFTDPNPEDETYEGNNILLGKLKKLYNVVPAEKN
jgi:hypothetical protein